MASLFGDVVQENSVGWKTDASKGPKKGVAVGRTPLGDLSNSVKHTAKQASKKQHLYENETSATNKKSIKIQASKKQQQPSNRKPLSDISNSRRPNLNEGSKKNRFAKLSVLAEEPIDDTDIAGEQFLHNHQECIKANSKAMDLDTFLQTLGLDNDFSKQESSPMPFHSPPRHFALEEMDDELVFKDESWKYKFPVELDSPSPSPMRSPMHFMEDYDFEFELLDSP